MKIMAHYVLNAASALLKELPYMSEQEALFWSQCPHVLRGRLKRALVLPKLKVWKKVQLPTRLFSSQEEGENVVSIGVFHQGNVELSVCRSTIQKLYFEERPTYEEVNERISILGGCLFESVMVSSALHEAICPKKETWAHTSNKAFFLVVRPNQKQKGVSDILRLANQMDRLHLRDSVIFLKQQA